jgi:hypothetical protein
MRYTLKRRVLGAPDFIEISEDEFNQWKSTQENLLAVLNIEATFDLFLENYAEFERDFLGLSHRLSLFHAHGEPLGPYREMNRRMMNLLSSARLYLDQVPQDLNSIDGKRSIHTDTFKQCCSKQYDSSFAYRVMEALRNYAQHCGFSIHAMTHSFEREDTYPGFLLRTRLHLFVNVQRLETSEFKKKVLNELKPKADRYGHIELTPLVPEYVEKLCEVHESLRGLISTDVASWDQIIPSVLDRARQAFGEDLSGLGVVAEEKHPEGEYLNIESADIFSEPIDWRKQLQAKNRDFGKLSARYVTGHAGRLTFKQSEGSR